MLAWVIAVHEVRFPAPLLVVGLPSLSVTWCSCLRCLQHLRCFVAARGTVSSETSQIADPYYSSIGNIWGRIHTDLTQIPLSFFCFQSKSHTSVSMAVVYPRSMRFFSLFKLCPGFLHFFPFLPLSFLLRFFFFFLACRGVGWEGVGAVEGEGGYCVSSWISPAKPDDCWLPFWVTFKWWDLLILHWLLFERVPGRYSDTADSRQRHFNVFKDQLASSQWYFQVTF